MDDQPDDDRGRLTDRIDPGTALLAIMGSLLAIQAAWVVAG